MAESQMSENQGFGMLKKALPQVGEGNAGRNFESSNP